MGKLTRETQCKAIAPNGNRCANDGYLHGYCLKHYCKIYGVKERPASERYSRAKIGRV